MVGSSMAQLLTAASQVRHFLYSLTTISTRTHMHAHTYNDNNNVF